MEKAQETTWLKLMLLAAISGFLLILIFPPFSLHFLVWVALIPLFFAIKCSSTRSAFTLGLVCGLIFCLGLCYWLLELQLWVGKLAWLAWISLSLFEAISFGLFALGVKVIDEHRSKAAQFVLIPTLMVSLEFLRSIGFWRFPWGVLGYSQAKNAYVLQVASILGVWGISFLIVLVNLLVYKMFISIKQRDTRWVFGLLISLILISGLVFIWGGKRFKDISAQAGTTIKVALVQGNIAQDEKWEEERLAKIESIYYEMTKGITREKVDLVVWPETAVPYFLNRDPSFSAEIGSLAKAKNSYFIVGGLYLNSENNQYNSAYFFSPTGELIDRYDKIFVVPFGEYMPPLPYFKQVQTVAGLGEDVTPGKRLPVLSIGKDKIGTVICFESGSDGLCRKLVMKGASALVVITNDAWFGHSVAAREHLEIGVLRAVENGVHLIQAANTGISSFITPSGKIISKTSLFKKRVLFGELSLLKSKTLFSRYGYTFPYLCIFIALVGLVLSFTRKARRK